MSVEVLKIWLSNLPRPSTNLSTPATPVNSNGTKHKFWWKRVRFAGQSKPLPIVTGFPKPNCRIHALLFDPPHHPFRTRI